MSILLDMWQVCTCIIVLLVGNVFDVPTSRHISRRPLRLSNRLIVVFYVNTIEPTLRLRRLHIKTSQLRIVECSGQTKN